MQTPSSNPKKNSARRRGADPHARLSARLRHISFGAAVLLVVAAALTVIYSLYKIQIRDGATYRQYAAEQQLLDSTIQATRGEIYDTSGITLASTSVVWTIWADPSYSTALYTTTTDQDTKAETRTINEAAMKEVCTQITLRLLSGDGESLDSVDTTSAEYQTQYQAVCDALSQNESSYQVLATKVNNAIKLSIEEYVKTYNKAHSKSGKSAGALKRAWPSWVWASRRATTAPPLSARDGCRCRPPRASSGITPMAALPLPCWASAMRMVRACTVWKTPMSPRWPV